VWCVCVCVNVCVCMNVCVSDVCVSDVCVSDVCVSGVWVCVNVCEWVRACVCVHREGHSVLGVATWERERNDQANTWRVYPSTDVCHINQVWK
jgi:hypothetical protein